jgi:hypothetical protein
MCYYFCVCYYFLKYGVFDDLLFCEVENELNEYLGNKELLTALQVREPIEIERRENFHSSVRTTLLLKPSPKSTCISFL